MNPLNIANLTLEDAGIQNGTGNALGSSSPVTSLYFVKRDKSSAMLLIFRLVVINESWLILPPSVVDEARYLLLFPWSSAYDEDQMWD